MTPYIITWLWIVGIPLAYGTFARDGAQASWWWALVSSVWPISAPLLLLLGLLAMRAERHSSR